MEIIKIIKEAIKEERESQEKYLNLADEASDPETRATLKQLAKDEEGHEKVLRERLAALRLMQEIQGE